MGNVDEAIDFLDSFEQVSMVMEGYKYPTLSLVVPLYNQLMSDLKACSENSQKTIAVRAAALAAYDKLNKY